MDRQTDPAAWKRAREIFDAVVDLPSAERRARLAALCDGDAALRADVESLLDNDQTSKDPISSIIGQAAEQATDGASAVHAGQTLLHYSVTEKIGEGGMGVVWRATDSSLDREVAIKVLPSDVARDAGRLARFEREAKVLASLNHTNIAAVYSLHQSEGVRFLAMEFVDGEDLSARIARGALPLAQVLSIARQVAEGLEEAHEKGIVHRDLKPANVKVTASGRVKVLDFGLAKALGTDVVPVTSSDPLGRAALSTLATRAGLILGTAAYMPPEQARGLPVDKRADIWAFGVMLFEMLAGARPFAGTTLTDVLAAVVSLEPDWTRLPGTTPAPFVRLVRRCLEKDVRQRLRDIGDARIDLEELAREALGPTTVTAPARGFRRGRQVIVGTVVVAAAVGAGMWIGRQSSPPEGRPVPRSLAVLPLVDLSPDQHEEYFADGLSEDLLNLLAQNPQLRVAGRTSAFRFKDAAQDPLAIGRTLNVSALLEGSVRRSGSRVRITAQLVNAEDGFQLWSDSYDRELDDVLAVQDEIARAVAGALQVTLLGGDPEASPARGRSGPAYNAYLQGKYFDRLNTRDGLNKAVAYFEEAVKLDPAFAPAWAGLAMARSAIGTEGYAPPDTVFGEARRAAERAVALDPQLADGHSALSVVRRVYDWDWAGADAEAQRALQLAPSNADIVLSAARIASTVGRLDEATTLARRAATLDPLNVTVHYRLGRYAYVLGQYDAARASFEKVLELNPDYPGAHHDLAQTLLALSRPDAALGELARETRPLWRVFGSALVYQRLGRLSEADAALAELIDGFEDTAAFQIAQVYAQRGQPELALEWLERAFVLRDTGLSQLKSAREFRPLERDPRFQAFLDKMRLPR